MKLIVNGVSYDFDVDHEVNPWDTLARTLRETLGLVGTKVSCDDGTCGTCTVEKDGKSVLACSTLTVECEGKQITTIEGLCKSGELHPLQQAFIDNDGQQCGFCTPGFIMRAKVFLDGNPSPNEQEIKEGLSGNLCRCGSYRGIVKAVLAAAAVQREEK